VEEPIQLRSDERRAETPVESFEAFVSDNHTRLFGALCLLTKDRYEAEEIAQEAYLRILERWDRVRIVEDPTAYLFRTAMNVFRKRFRRARLAVLRAASLAPADDFVDRIAANDLVVRAIAELPTDQRAALIVTSLLGYPSDEAARIIGARPSTVRARATRARSALREAIGEDQ